jgi:putative oxidoreductase
MPGDWKWLDLPARILMSLLFLFSGYTKLAATGYIQSYMAAFGVPPMLIWPAAALEIGGGVLLLLGLGVRPLSLVYTGWCLLTAAIFHIRWSDPVQPLMFLKNMTMAGGFLVYAVAGSSSVSLDRLLARRGIALWPEHRAA